MMNQFWCTIATKAVGTPGDLTLFLRNQMYYCMSNLMVYMNLSVSINDNADIIRQKVELFSAVLSFMN